MLILLVYCRSLPLVTAMRLRQTSRLVTWDVAVCFVFHKDCYLHWCVYCHVLLRSSQLYLTSMSCLSRLGFSAEVLVGRLYCHYYLQFLKTHELFLTAAAKHVFFCILLPFVHLSLATIRYKIFTTLLSYFWCIGICRVVKLHALRFRCIWRILCGPISTGVSLFLSIWSCSWLRSFPKVSEALLH